MKPKVALFGNKFIILMIFDELQDGKIQIVVSWLVLIISQRFRASFLSRWDLNPQSHSIIQIRSTTQPQFRLGLGLTITTVVDKLVFLWYYANMFSVNTTQAGVHEHTDPIDFNGFPESSQSVSQFGQLSYSFDGTISVLYFWVQCCFLGHLKGVKASSKRQMLQSHASLQHRQWQRLTISIKNFPIYLHYGISVLPKIVTVVN